MHHLMESAGKFKDQHISCIPNNMEKYISFNLGNLRFIDSLQLNTSLDTLVENLAKEGKEKFTNLIKHFPDPDHHQLLTRKGVFPYDFFTSPETFQTTTLSTKQQFYNKLNDTEVSDDDYTHTQTVWQTFDMQTFGQYHDLYFCLLMCCFLLMFLKTSARCV